MQRLNISKNMSKKLFNYQDFNIKKMSSKLTSPKKDEKNKIFKFNLYWMYAIIFFLLTAIYFSSSDTESKEVSWTQFKQLTIEQSFDKIVVFNQKNMAEATIVKDVDKKIFTDRDIKIEGIKKVYANIPSSDKFSDFYDKAVTEHNVKTQVSFKDGSDKFWDILISYGPFILLIGIWFFLIRGMSSGAGGGASGMFNVGKAKAKLFDKNSTEKVTFNEVAGLSEAKQEVEEIVSFLRNPSKYTELGGKIPKGALLVGPPGTGKTLLAKAVAGEADVPFFSLSGSDFVEMFVGVGASRVRDLFRQAKEKAPAIIFIDEIDAVGRARNKTAGMNSNDERENTLNQLLTEMDGFGSNSGVIILAATNRADILDKALLRAGRFDRQIHVDLPDLNERKAIFEVHLRPIKTDESFEPDLLARQTPGFSGADIANVCNEAALIAARQNKKFVQIDDFTNAVDRIVGGLEKKAKITTKEERHSIAIHESGHASLSWLLEHANPLVKVTIVPRGKALGAAWYLPEERQITTKEQLLDEMCALLGGRAAEEVFLGRISTGAANDLERTTKLAYAMVSYFGMSEKLLNLNYNDSTGQEYSFNKPYSDETAKLIDQEAMKLINNQYLRAKDMLLKYKVQHNKLAQLLLDKEVIFATDVEKIFGKRKWVSRTEEILEQVASDKALKDKEKKESTDSDEVTEKKNAPTSSKKKAETTDEESSLFVSE